MLRLAKQRRRVNNAVLPQLLTQLLSRISLVAVRGRDEYQRKTRRIPFARISLAPEQVADQR
jgi:cell division protein FtsB